MIALTRDRPRDAVLCGRALRSFVPIRDLFLRLLWHSLWLSSACHALRAPALWFAMPNDRTLFQWWPLLLSRSTVLLRCFTCPLFYSFFMIPVSSFVILQLLSFTLPIGLQFFLSRFVLSFIILYLSSCIVLSRSLSFLLRLLPSVSSSYHLFLSSSFIYALSFCIVLSLSPLFSENFASFLHSSHLPSLSLSSFVHVFSFLKIIPPLFRSNIFSCYPLHI